MASDILGYEDFPGFIEERRDHAKNMIAAANNISALYHYSPCLDNNEFGHVLNCLTSSKNTKVLADSIYNLGQCNLSISKSINDSVNNLVNSQLYPEYRQLQHEILELEDKLLQIGMLKQAYSEFKFDKIPEINLNAIDIKFISYILDDKHVKQFSKDLFSYLSPWEILQKYLCNTKIRILHDVFELPALGTKRFTCNRIFKIEKLQEAYKMALNINGYYIYPLKNSYGRILYDLDDIECNYIKFKNYPSFEERIAICTLLDSTSTTELLRALRENFSEDMFTDDDLTSFRIIQDSIILANLIIDVTNSRTLYKSLVNALRKYRLTN